MNFTLSGTNVDYVFTTHYNQDEENYGIYWTYYVDADGICGGPDRLTREDTV